MKLGLPKLQCPARPFIRRGAAVFCPLPHDASLSGIRHSAVSFGRYETSTSFLQPSERLRAMRCAGSDAAEGEDAKTQEEVVRLHAPCGRETHNHLINPCNATREHTTYEVMAALAVHCNIEATLKERILAQTRSPALQEQMHSTLKNTFIQY